MYTVQKNERINIRALNNGYMAEYSYRKSLVNDYSTQEEEYYFTTWDGVVDWLKTKQLTVPPETLTIGNDTTTTL